MKHLLFLFLLASAILGHSQSVKKVRKVVQVLPQQTFYLNGGMRASFGGKSRVYYQVDLPKNTVEWYYIFSTQEGQSTSSASLNLVPQLTRLVDPTGITAVVASAIMCPTGSNSCDIIFMRDRQNAQAFENKVDQNGGTYYYQKSPSRENYRNGTVQISDLVTGTYYLGFRNPSASTGISVTFEVAAIVEETVVDENTQKAVNYGNLGWKAYEAGDIDKCILYSKKALELDNTLIYVKLNLGLCFLIKNDELTGMDYYMDALADIKKLPDFKQRQAYINAALQDINGALRKYPNMPGAAEVKALFTQ
jgi:tetratricopeptide (TPR) repeat protein